MKSVINRAVSFLCTLCLLTFPAVAHQLDNNRGHSYKRHCKDKNHNIHNNFRASTGIVHGFGTHPTVASFTNRARSADEAVKLGVLGKSDAGRGFRITAVTPGSPAAQAGFIPAKDMIIAVNGKTVKTANDINAVLSTASSGKVSFTVIHEYWRMEKTLIFPDDSFSFGNATALSATATQRTLPKCPPAQVGRYSIKVAEPQWEKCTPSGK